LTKQILPSLAVVAGAIVSASILAQAPQEQPTFRTEANYIRVDAYPTKDGAPVGDLTRDDFEIIEGGQPQKIEQFERVVIRGSVPQDARVEPASVEQSRQAAQNPRARVFVVFLDVNHVGVEGSHDIRRPLIEALDRLIGPDDLFAVMTPEMSAADIAFARKTTTIEGFLAKYWNWGERHQLNSTEDQYRACYPGTGPNRACSDDDRGVADEMIERRREKQTIDALQDLVRYLRGVREERKAIITITDGWRLFTSDPRLARRLRCRVPTGPDVGIDPRNGRLSTRPREDGGAGNPDTCDSDRMALSQIDDEHQFRQMLDEANRANASFYPVDPRGLPVFDEPISKNTTGAPPPGSSTITPPSVDNARLTARLNSLRTLAEATDGLAIVNSNDLAGGMRRVVADLTSYYLLGYYSTLKLDGKFHSITVRLKRPGVQVRARRGYFAASAAEAARAERDAGRGAVPARDSEALAIESALSPLGSFGRETSLRLRAAAGWRENGKAQVWVVGELGAADTWRLGADAEVALSKEGELLASASASVPPGSRTFKVALTPSSTLSSGDYTVSVRTRATSLLATSSDVVQLPLPPAPQNYGSLLIRKGPFTGVKEVPTADLRFRRSEQLRVEVPLSGGDSASARLLDRTGKPMTAVPMTATVRADADGTRWMSSQVPLFPLGPGDYLVEMTAGTVKVLTPFRIVP
jgi:VWFA-related protein